MFTFLQSHSFLQTTMPIKTISSLTAAMYREVGVWQIFSDMLIRRLMLCRAPGWSVPSLFLCVSHCSLSPEGSLRREKQPNSSGERRADRLSWAPLRPCYTQATNVYLHTWGKSGYLCITQYVYIDADIEFSKYIVERKYQEKKISTVIQIKTVTNYHDGDV